MYKKMTKAERRIRLIGVKIGILEDVRLSFGLPCFIFGWGVLGLTLRLVMERGPLN